MTYFCVGSPVIWHTRPYTKNLFMTIRGEIILQERVEAPDVLLNIGAALHRSDLRLDAVRRYRKAGFQTPISEK